MSAHCLKQNLSSKLSPNLYSHRRYWYSVFLVLVAATNLGITLTNNLSTQKHVTNICRSAYIEIQRHLSLSHYWCNKNPHLCLFCQNLTTVILFYQVLQNIFLTSSKRSNLLQPDLSSKLASMNTWRTPLLQKLHWLPIFSRIQYNFSIKLQLCATVFPLKLPSLSFWTPDCLPSIQTTLLHF